MPYQLDPFQSIPLDEPLLRLLLDEHAARALPRLSRLWCYYRNALAEPDERGGSRGAPEQSAGLPQRLLDVRRHEDIRVLREIVIENDIGWRIHTLVDFMFPAAPVIQSMAADSNTRQVIETLLEAVIDASGGIALWQNAALLGSVFGHVDFLLHLTDSAGRPDAASRAPATGRPPGERPGNAPSNPSPPQAPSLARTSAHAARALQLETVEAPRAFALLNPNDYRVIDAFVLTYRRPSHDVRKPTMLERITSAMRSRAVPAERAYVDVVEVFSPTHHQRYEDEVLVAESVNRLGRMPVVHVQNLAQPLRYEGLSDVEPLIPLQDELNTRLSDRANRVTMQSFRMWLGKGIDGFTERPIGPGQMWLTDNLDASIESFGGDADSPSERAHIEELREALDKASGVTPAAAGHIKAKIGNLTSENALRISLMGTIAKIKRKRITYGRGIDQVCELILHALDVLGILRTDPADRRVEVKWTDPLPVDESRRITDALAKAQLGVPLETLRAELGYGDDH